MLDPTVWAVIESYAVGFCVKGPDLVVSNVCGAVAIGTSVDDAVEAAPVACET